MLMEQLEFIGNEANEKKEAIINSGEKLQRYKKCYFNKHVLCDREWYLMLVIPALWELRREDHLRPVVPDQNQAAL